MNKNLLRAPIELASRFNKNTETQTASYRSDFMRDRDRIMYCNAFRRLDGKTQIYLIGSDDHRRNRLTHTLEVAQIARTISQALGLDEDLTEAIALGHDLGHTPFGHAQRLGSTCERGGRRHGVVGNPGIGKLIYGLRHLDNDQG